MQVLAEKGFEFGEHKGLGWVSGNVKKLNTKIYPHYILDGMKLI